MASPRSAAAAPLKSALRMATRPDMGPGPDPAGSTLVANPAARIPSRAVSAADMRQMMISEFAAWLGTQVSKKTKRPYQPHTITDHAAAPARLSRWMTAQGIEEDFTACDVAMLNWFFAGYLASHTQGGTNTLQRNLAHIYGWLEKTYGHPDPYASRDLNRYAPVKNRPTTLSEEFIHDVLELTGGGRARDFQTARDHALIRVFTEGPCVTEVAQMELADLSPDMIAQPYARLVPLKAARQFTEGRWRPFAPSTGKAIMVYLRVRGAHPKADLPSLWLGTRGRGPLTSSGIYQVVKRLTRQAGYDPKTVWPHLYRHTLAHDWLDGGGSEGDLMRLMGWTDRQMLDPYAADLQDQRAMEAKRRRGDIY